MSELNVYLLAFGIIMVILFFVYKLSQPTKILTGGCKCNNKWIFIIIGLSICALIYKFYMHT